jgi:hypothetical protein
MYLVGGIADNAIDQSICTEIDVLVSCMGEEEEEDRLIFYKNNTPSVPK